MRIDFAKSTALESSRAWEDRMPTLVYDATAGHGRLAGLGLSAADFEFVQIGRAHV